MGENTVPQNSQFQNQSPQLQPHIVHRIFSLRVLFTTIILVVLAVCVYLSVLYWTETVPADYSIRIEKSDTVKTIANRLSTTGVIKHPLFFYVGYYLFGQNEPFEPGGYRLSNTMKVRDIVHVLQSEPTSKYVTIFPGSTKSEITNALSEELGWEAIDKQYFSHTYAGMQWQDYHEQIEEYFKEKYNWGLRNMNTFLSLSAMYYDETYDFLNNMYVPGTYEIPVSYSRAQVAGILIDQFNKENPDIKNNLEKYADPVATENIAKLIQNEDVLMPDIEALPPRDITIKQVDGRMKLLFSTLYWNKGRGPLELIADPKSKSMVGDNVRTVYQRIYRLDSDYTDYLSGKFLWHSPHLHYHFEDFALYSLEPALTNASGTLPKLSQKSTFCIRDTEPVDLTHPGANKSASFIVCGKERQGISAGWADAYYYTYVDQNFDITDLPTGEYVLKIVINPLDRFKEITKENNIGEADIYIDKKAGTVKVISERTYGTK